MTIKHVWKIDSIQSRIAFKVGYMLMGVIAGEFRKFSGRLLADESFQEPELRLSIEARSITTFQKERDDYLRGPGFLDTEGYSYIRYVSISYRRVSTGGLFEMTGLLTIRDITAPVTIVLSLVALIQDKSETVSAHYKVSGALLRSAFGLDINASGKEWFADEVTFWGDIRLRREKT